MVSVLPGQAPNTLSQTFDVPGPGTWTCPTGVATVLVTCIGGGGGDGVGGGYRPNGGGGGGLAWSTNVPVQPGTVYNLNVGQVGGTNSNGSDSTFAAGSVLIRGGGGGGGSAVNNTPGIGGTYSGGSGGGNGGSGGRATAGGDYDGSYGGGGGAGGYSGDGGNGGNGRGSDNSNGGNGTGGGGGGGGGLFSSYSGGAGYGGGTGLDYITQTNGIGGVNGSNGQPGSNGNGPRYGGGKGSWTTGVNGGDGVVYIEWSLKPGQPIFTNTKFGDRKLAFNWSPPRHTVGGAVTKYTITCTDPNNNIYTPTTMQTNVALFFELTNGTPYTAKIYATNAYGDGALIASSPATPGVATFGNTTVGNAELTFNWTAPTDTGGSPITGHNITCTDGDFIFSPQGGTNDIVSGTSARFIGLTNGTSYTAELFSITATGYSYSVASESSIPFGPPSTPTFGTTTIGNGTLTFNWTAPEDNGGRPITGYTIVCNGVSRTITALTSQFTGLTNGTPYTATIYATNQRGNGTSVTSVSAVPVGPPGVPTFGTPVIGNGTLTFNWTAPINTGGTPITGYTIVVNNITRTVTTLSSQFTGLTNGTTYTAYLYAQTVVGNSDTIDISASPGTVPSTPTFGTTVVGNKTLTFNWTEPTNNGGRSITGYTIVCNNVTRTITTLSSQFTGLTNGTSYTASIYATTSLGNSTTVTSVSSIPVGPPDEPTFGATTVGNGTLTFNWTPRPDTGGSPITGYTIVCNSGDLEFQPVGGNPVRSTSATFTGLTNGTTYTAYLYTRTVVGNSNTINISATPAIKPSTPTFGTTVVGNKTLTFNWTEPTNNGGSPITGYTIVCNNVTRTVTTLSSQFTGLTNGRPYTASIYATNGAGNSTTVTSVGSTPFGLPDAPTFGATTVGNGTLTFNWTAPTDTGGSPITGYTIVCNSGDLEFLPVGGNPRTNRTATFTGLTNGTTYTAYLYVRTVYGISDTIDISATPAIKPSTPTFGTTVVGNGTLTFNWTEPTNTGGIPITGYTIGCNKVTRTVTTLSSQFTGLTNSTSYTATIYATNGAGNSTTVTSAKAIPVGPPGVPTFGTTVVGNGTLTFKWTAPKNNGGRPITGYTIVCNGVSRTITALTSQFTGLTNGTPYTATIYATNTEGNSTSVTSVSSIPIGPPGIPVFGNPIIGNKTLTFNWTAPTDTGGSIITGYTIVCNKVTRNVTTRTSSFTGLKNGTTYTATIYAKNKSGKGAIASITATPSV